MTTTLHFTKMFRAVARAARVGVATGRGAGLTTGARTLARVAAVGVGSVAAVGLGVVGTTALCENSRIPRIPRWGIPGTAQERTFIALKPDAVQRGLIGEIISRFEKRGFKLVAMKLYYPTKKEAENHYADLSKKKFFGPLTDFFSSAPIVCMVWEGTNAVSQGRWMMGETDPQKSLPGSIRGDFSINLGRNIIHGSDSNDSAKHEIGMWFTDAEMCDYKRAIDTWNYE